MIDSFDASFTSNNLKVQVNFYSSGKLVCDFFGELNSFTLFINSDSDFVFLFGDSSKRVFLYLSESCFNNLNSFFSFN